MINNKETIFLKHKVVLEQMGENIKLARKSRKLIAIQVSERVDIARIHLYQIENGILLWLLVLDLIYFGYLELQDDSLKLGTDDTFGRELHNLDLS
ncbi:helix-turn-helix transcriptional regulator [Flavobacterium sp.]|uniref:helix-turn-helix transcriptional regulator n=1 Tax=Flavobacterium sp. TaxID=239 RepID=UPI00286DAD83|nr:helix-turn-helix transcriptional regulator [Flavobacterium sp.]